MLTSIAPFHNGLLGSPSQGATSQGANAGLAGAGRETAGGRGLHHAPAPADILPDAPATGAPPSSAFDTAAQRLVGRALDALGQDFGKLLKGLGPLGATVKEMLAGALQPIRQALEQGLDFTAEIRVAAVRQQTLVTQSGYAQDLDLVAKSLTIEVNHTTGEVAVSLQSLSIEQSAAVSFAGPAPQPEFGAVPPGLALGDHGLSDFVERLLRESRAGEDAAEDPRAAGEGVARAALLDTLRDALPGAAATGAPGTEAPETEAGQGGEGPGPRTRVALRAAERFHNEAGHFVSRLRLEVAVRLAGHNDIKPLIEALPPAGNGAGLDLHA